MAVVIEREARDRAWAKVGYKPHPKQRLFHDSTARFRIPCCGRRFGKSTMAGNDLLPKMFIPKKMYWIVGPTYDLGEKEFRPLWDGLILKMQLGKDKRVKKAFNKRSGEMYIELPWQTRVEVRSAQHPDTLVGEGLDHVIMSEAAKHRSETWERFIRPALSDKRGSADFPTTPEGHNWLYHLWLLGQNEQLPSYASWRFPSWDNPIVYPAGELDEEIKLLRLTTNTEWFDQEIGADFASFVGKIYGEWDDSIHIKSHVYNPAWPNYMCFDWGFTNPLAAVEFQVDPWDNIYVWREHYKAYTTLESHLELMGQRQHPAGYKVDCAFGDAADPEAAMYVSMHSDKATNGQKFGCVADPEAKANWREGVDLHKTFLKLYDTGMVSDEDGTPIQQPKFFVDPKCSNTIREHNNYRAKEGTSAKNAAEIAQGVDDHCLDAIRYGEMHLYKLGAHHHLDPLMANDVELVTATSLQHESIFNLNQEW